MAWMSPRSTSVDDGLDESQERPMTWMNPRNTRVAGGLVDFKEHWDGDYTKRWYNSKWTTLREVWPMDKDGRFLRLSMHI